MRFPFPLTLVLSCFVFCANAAPRPKGKRKLTVAATIRAMPLSPAQLVGKVVYIAVDGDVWALNPQTRHQQLLYKGLGTVSWSPNREQVAFVPYSTNDDDYNEAFIMNWDGSAKRQVSKGYKPSNPRWSPDGGKLLYTQTDTLHRSPIQTVGFCIVDLKGKEPNYNSDREAGRYLFPYWSRDGRQILASYMSYDRWEDASEFDKLPLKVLSLDGKPVEDFKGNWQDFIVDNQSRDGKRRAEHIKFIHPSLGEWQVEEADNVRNVIWEEGDGFTIYGVRFGDDTKQVTVEGSLIQWTIDSQGAAHAQGLHGIWLVTLKNQMQPSLQILAKDAHLIDWF